MPAGGWYFAEGYNYGGMRMYSYVTSQSLNYSTTDRDYRPYLRMWIRDVLWIRRTQAYDHHAALGLRRKAAYAGNLWQASAQKDSSRFVETMSKFLKVDLVFCTMCSGIRIGPLAEIEGYEDRGAICSQCRDQNFFRCEYCDILYHVDDRNTNGHAYMCTGCIEQEHFYCGRYCGVWHHNDTGCPREGCKCSSSSLDFTFPNAGGLLANDEKTTVKLPAGIIADEGINAIIDHMRYYFADAPREVVSTLSNEWMTSHGNFTKRLSRAMFKFNGYKAPEGLLTMVGNYATDYSSKEASMRVSLTRNLNLPAKDFYHSESCWWGSYASSRCSLKTLHGIGLRSWHGSVVRGRAWIMCFDKDMSPTDSTDAHAYMVFNGYGNLAGYNGARVVAFMTGRSYRKVRFVCSPMYVNNSAGYIIADEQTIKTYANASIQVQALRDHHRKQNERTLVEVGNH